MALQWLVGAKQKKKNEKTRRKSKVQLQKGFNGSELENTTIVIIKTKT